MKRDKHEVITLNKNLSDEIAKRKKIEKEADTNKAACLKLQSLCREFQNQNKKMKAEQLRLAKDEEDRRKQLIEKFQGSLENITKQLDLNSENNSQLKRDNIKLTEQLSEVAGKYKERETQYLKTLEICQEQESLMRQKIEALEEARKSDGEKMNETMKDLMNKTQMVIHLSVEKEQLHKQVSYYSERFEDFNETLAKSNEAISGFSNEMAKLQKINSRLDKSALDWKKKHHHCQAQLLEATETNLKLTQKTKKLESLCRALQERQKKATETKTADEKCSSSPSKGNQNSSEESGNEV